jgi:glucokinase
LTESLGQVLVDIDGLTARFALSSAASGIASDTIRTYQTKDFPTATDCMQAFARDSGTGLAGKRCAVSVSGSVHGDTIRIARCPWIVSAQGFGYLFQTKVAVLNDSAAKLWAATDPQIRLHKPLGAHDLPDFGKSGSWLGINFDTGLGAAVMVAKADCGMLHVATEAGHMAFAPNSEEEYLLAKALAVGNKPASWERALFGDKSGAAAPNSPELSEAFSQVKIAERLGSFVGDLIMGTGTWGGVVLFGKAHKLLEDAACLSAYKRRLETRANYSLQLRAVPQWTLDIPDINLAGVRRYLQFTME